MRKSLLIISCGLAAACGQTGSLYLPDEGITTPVEIREARPPAAPEEAPETEPDESATAGPES